MPITRSIPPALIVLPLPPLAMPANRAALPFGTPRAYIRACASSLGERNPMSRKATQRLSFFLLMGLTLYAALWGAG